MSPRRSSRTEPTDPRGPDRPRRGRRRGGVLVAAAWLAFAVWAVVGDGGLLDVRRVEGEQERLEAELRELHAANADLERRIEGLEADPLEIERLARETLDYQAPGETVYLLPEAAP